MSAHRLPLFPLHTVLFPGGVLPLRVFETRYLDMVSDCLRNDHGFGVCLIRAGREVGTAPDCHGLGTLARIRDWDRTPEGLLLITAEGERRFRITEQTVRADQLIVAEVDYLDDPPPQPLPLEYARLARLLDALLDDLDAPYRDLPRRLDDAGWVGARLVEFLPLDPLEKQSLLEEGDVLARLAAVAAHLGRG